MERVMAAFSLSSISGSVVELSQLVIKEIDINKEVYKKELTTRMKWLCIEFCRGDINISTEVLKQPYRLLTGF
jgi:hypothetical protein